MLYVFPLTLNCFWPCWTCLHVKHLGFLHWYIPLIGNRVSDGLMLEMEGLSLLGATCKPQVAYRKAMMVGLRCGSWSRNTQCFLRILSIF